VTQKKKTLYEILAVSSKASYPDIQAAYQSMLGQLEVEKDRLGRDDYAFKLKVLSVAFNTLSTPATRDAYDARLTTLDAPAPVGASRNAVVLQPDATAISLRAEAMSLRAEAMSLRADALSMKADAAPFTHESDAQSVASSIFSNVAPALRKAAVIVGAVLAVGMVIQVAFLLMANRRGDGDSGGVSKASEKAAIQEYYQTHGVRPGSKIEADLLEVENRRKENEQRTTEREKQRTKDDSERFEVESRRKGEQAAEAVRLAEEQAREQGRREDERKKAQQEEDRRVKDEATRIRLEKEKDKWRETLGRGG